MSLIWLNINIDLRRPFQLYVLINVLNHWFHQLGRLIEWGRKLLDTRNGWWQCEMMNRSITSSSSTFPCLHGTEGNSRGTQLDALPVTNIFYSSEAVDGGHAGALALVNRLQELFNFLCELDTSILVTSDEPIGYRDVNVPTAAVHQLRRGRNTLQMQLNKQINKNT